MKNKYDVLINILTLLYVVVPIIIFFVGWLHVVYAILVTIVLIYSTVAYVQRIEKSTAPSELNVDWKKTILIALIGFVWVYCSGIGGYTNQQWDHHARNAIFYDLLTFDWPIYYDFPASYHLKALAGRHSSLNYYFTFWLPAACVGKLFGTQVANAFLLLWAYAGILLSFYYLNRLFHFNYSFVCVGLFIFWSNFDLFGYIFIQRILPTIDFLPGTAHYQFYTAFTGDLYNPFNQAVPTWLLTLHVLNAGKKLQIFPVVILLAYSPFAFIGLAIAHGLHYLISVYQTNKKNLDVGLDIRQALLRPDMLGALLILISYALFYQAHASGVQNVPFWKLYLTRGLWSNTVSMISYLITFFLEAGIYLLFIYALAKRTYQAYKVWFWLSFVVLLILPFWVIGTYGDLASRGSMPFLTVLLIMTVAALIELEKSWGRSRQFYAVLFVLFLSFYTPIHSLVYSLSFTDKPIRCNAVGSLADPKPDEMNDPENMVGTINNYYSHEPQHFLFYRYLAKR